MSLKIKNLPDFMSGLIFTSLGLVVMWAAGEYRLLIFSKNMTTDSLLVRYIFKVVIGEYWDGTKEV
ncbi:MAG: hypothetical protein ING14_08220, partial [Burkholderiales bacterium]|nr:hypothetical protein [Burkholderiales bacterium]